MTAAVCALYAVDKGEVFPAERFDDVIDVIGRALFQPRPDFPIFVIVLFVKAVGSLIDRSQSQEP